MKELTTGPVRIFTQNRAKEFSMTTPMSPAEALDNAGKLVRAAEENAKCRIQAWVTSSDENLRLAVAMHRAIDRSRPNAGYLRPILENLTRHQIDFEWPAQWSMSDAAGMFRDAIAGQED